MWAMWAVSLRHAVSDTTAVRPALLLMGGRGESAVDIVLVIIILRCLLRQRAACSSMLLTHKHSPKKESQGKRNLCTTSNSLLYNGIYFRLNLIHLLQNTCPNCPFLRITTTLLLYLLLSTVFATRQSISFQSIIARLI